MVSMSAMATVTDSLSSKSLAPPHTTKSDVGMSAVGIWDAERDSSVSIPGT